MWIFETIALSVITALLLLLMLSRKPGRLKLVLGVFTAVAAVVSMVLFLLMRRAAGSLPGGDMAAAQLYGPCGVYLLAALFSLFMAALSRRKLRREKAARAAEKQRAAREAEAQRAAQKAEEQRTACEAEKPSEDSPV